MQQIELHQLDQLLLEDKDVFLLDVREEQEHEKYNIGGVLIPLSEIITNAHNIPKDKPVIVYCRKGIRSQIAIQRLEEKFGYTNLINLRGGIGDGDNKK